jgi:hypothetical protein
MARASIRHHLRQGFGMAAVLILALGIWLYRSRPENPPGGGPTQPQVQSIIVVHLTSGLVKGQGRTTDGVPTASQRRRYQSGSGTACSIFPSPGQ